MGMGKFVQVGTPLEIYTNPSNKFVASFIDLINLFHGKVMKVNQTNVIIKTNNRLELKAYPDDNFKKDKEVLVAVRPEHIEIHSQDFTPRKENSIIGKVSGIEYLGDLSRYNIKTEYQTIKADQYSPSIEKAFEFGEKVLLSFSKENVHLIDEL